MQNVPVTLLYAGLLGLLMSLLSIRVPMRRGVLDVPFGDGGDEVLATRIRAFGNFTEYIPFVLLEMLLLELSGESSSLLHALGATLVGARLLHATIYVARSELSIIEKVGRGVSAMTTWMVLTAGAGLLLRQAL